ncbi:MAG: signal recognition particle-docking protein FtsY [Caldiserica bacterium]|nr:signal recognition particle-docking protein FtsY [Caldisericota bacterium]
MSFLSRVKQLFGGDKPAEEDSPVQTAEVAAELQQPAVPDAAQAEHQQAGGTRRELADFDALEELLIDAGIDVDTTMAILQEVRKGGLRGRPTGEQVIERIRAKLNSVFDLDSTLHTTGSPAVILVTGVNGTGKTSSIAKLANMLKQQNRKVLLVAADTFRAGAVDQLAILAGRVGVPVMRSVEGQDPSSVVFNGLQKAVADKVDVVVIDTAGRLENKKNLTFELQKVVRVIETKFGLPLSETLLVIDATTGENALMQARAFSEAIPISGIILTKIDSGAKGGSIVSIARELRIPIKLVCNGETLMSIKPFDKDDIVNMILLSE